MLFSNPNVATLLNDNFECAWQSVRAVPKATIDFGNGHVLERTLSGNVVTWVCTPEGRVMHAIPGLLLPSSYQEELGQGLDLWGEVRTEGAAAVVAFHRARVRGTSQAKPPLVDDGVVDFSKVAVEGPIKDAFAAGHSPLRFERVVATPPALLRLSKSAVETPVKAALGGHPQSGEDPQLEADDEHNLTVRMPLLAGLLAESPLAPPGILYRDVFRDILHVDLADPYLGLAPYLLGGDVGRR